MCICHKNMGLSWVVSSRNTYFIDTHTHMYTSTRSGGACPDKATYALRASTHSIYRHMSYYMNGFIVGTMQLPNLLQYS